jgi:WD40 repeat protein
LHHVSWSFDSSCIAIVGNGFDSRIAVYHLAHVPESDKIELRLLWEDRAGVVSAKHWEESGSEPGSPPLSGRSDDTSVHSRSRFEDTPLLPAFETCEFLPSGGVVVTEDCPNGKCNLLHLYSSDGRHEKLFELIPDQSGKRLSVILITSCHNNIFVVGLQGGHIMLFDDTDLKLVGKFCIGVTPRTCVWDEDLLLFPSDSGKLLWWSPQSGECVKEVKILEQDYFVRIDWDTPGESLFVCGFTTLNHVSLKKESGRIVDAVITQFDCGGEKVEGIIRGFQISCCGLEFSPSAERLAVGDLAGAVWVCPVVGDNPLISANVGMSVRCLVWLNEDTVVVGTLDGLIHLWNITSKDEPMIVQYLEGSVLHMRWAHQSKLLAVGTSHGQLHIYDWRNAEAMVEMVQFCAHKPEDGKQNPLFGQLGKQAEIWSLCWSPDDHMVITCSEDQTSKVWESASWKLVTTLKNHKMAVTSVDWKNIGGKSFIATCADDQVRDILRFQSSCCTS